MNVTLLTTDKQIEQQSDNAIKALSQCYQSKNMNLNKLVNISMVKGHKSILEYFDLVFNIEGISYISHVHLVRQRLTSPMTQSQRYTSTYDIVIPDKIKGNKLLEIIFIKQAESAFTAYIELIKNGATIEDARYILPQGVKINMSIHMNLREFLYICDLRIAKGVLKETHDIVSAMKLECLKNDIIRRFFTE